MEQAHEADMGAPLIEPAELSQRRLEVVCNNATVALFIIDERQRCVYLNPAAEQMTGFTLAELQDHPLHDVIHHTRPDGSPYPLEECPIDRAFPRNNRQQGEETFVHKDGHFYPVSYTASPVREQGKIVGTVIEVRDISQERTAERALHESEKLLRAVIEATPECVKLVAQDGRLLHMNRAGLTMVEADGENSVCGVSVYPLIMAQPREQWIEHHRRVCAGERLNWEFEIIGLRGGHRWMETHAVPLAMPDGTTAQLAITRDISARKQTEQEREELLASERVARSEAERASRLKDEFLATLSHELRTPLNAILGWAQLLRHSGLSGDDHRQGLETIERNARLQAQIIEDLLDMSRIISGKIRLDVQRLDLPAVLEAAIETVRPAAEAKNVRLQPILDPLAGPVSGDPSRLQQVFWNLLSNAIKFTDKGGRVQVLLERVNSHLEVSVLDTGQGILPEFLPFVFDRFRQADSSTTRQHGGLGLGLAIAKQLVELHGGSIRAKSAGEGQGATFVVQLPITVVHAEPDPDRQHPRYEDSAPSFEPTPDLTDVRVVVVDDEPDARELVKRLLMDRNASVAVAGSAAEALRLIEVFRPHVLVSDIGMPGEDGYSLIRKVRQLPPTRGRSTPAIALTAYARSEDRRRAILNGYQMHVPKPVEPSELLTMVASLAGRT